MRTIDGVVGIAASLLVAALGGCSSNESSFDQAQAESEIRHMEHAWAQIAVSGDTSHIADILADDFLGVSPDGAQYTRQQFIDDTKAHPLGFTSNVVNDVKIRFHGDTAVAQGDETFTTTSGEQARFVWTDVVVRRNGEWRIVAAQDVVAPVAGHSASASLFSGADGEASARTEIDKTRAAYAAAWQKADAAVIAELYTEDAKVLYPDQAPVAGRGNIREYFKGFFQEFPKNEFVLATSEVVINGDWAFDNGTYTWKATPAAGGKPQEDHGKYLVILRRQADGRWLVARDMDNSSLPAAQRTRSAQ